MFSASIINRKYLAIATAFRLEIVLLTLFCLNAIDAVATLSWINADLATEANPLMDYLLQTHPLAFILGKMSLAGLGCLLLWRLRRHPFTSTGSFTLVIIYGAVCLYHFAAFTAFSV